MVTRAAPLKKSKSQKQYEQDLVALELELRAFGKQTKKVLSLAKHIAMKHNIVSRVKHHVTRVEEHLMNLRTRSK